MKHHMASLWQQSYLWSVLKVTSTICSVVTTKNNFCIFAIFASMTLTFDLSRSGPLTIQVKKNFGEGPLWNFLILLGVNPTILGTHPQMDRQTNICHAHKQ